jgi:hypothetical protein
MGMTVKRAFVVALACTCVALGYFAATALAFTNNYCGVLIAQNVWCGDGSNHTYHYNQAQYTGGGTVTVCERLLVADTTTVRGTPQCGSNFVAHEYGATSNLYEAEVRHINSGGASHTIYGQAIA